MNVFFRHYKGQVRWQAGGVAGAGAPPQARQHGHRRLGQLL